MAQWLKQSTAGTVISFGPFVDATDGVTLETGLVSALDHATTGIMLSKNGGVFAVRNATVTASTYDAYGNYRVTLDATDTGTTGRLRVQFVQPATCLAVWQDFDVKPANVFDSLVTGEGTDLLKVDSTQLLGTAYVTPATAGIQDVNSIQVSGDATAANNLEAAFDDTAGAVPWTGIIDQGTAQSATGTTIVLRAAAAFADDELNGAVVVITGGTTGVGQRRVINDYAGATDTATVDAWATTPTGTITYKIFWAASLPSGVPSPVNVIQISGDTAAADNAESFFDGVGYAGTNNVIPTVTNVTTVNGLASAVITATSIAADAITAAKVADGTIDAATFAANAITATAIAADAITAAKVADGTIDAATFAAGAINAASIAADAITAAKIADGAIDAATFTAGAIDAAAIANGAIDAATFAAGAIDAAAIANGAIDAATFAAGAIDAAAIANGAIDAATFAAGAINAAAIASDAITAAKVAADVTTELRALASGTADSGSTTTLVDDALNQADTDYWKDCFVLFTSGSIAGQVRLITAFTPASDQLTFAPPTTQAVSTNAYEILPAGRVDVELWDGSAVNALVAGRVDSSVGAVVGDTVAASNAEAFFDGTGYAGGTTKLQVDTIAISGDTTAADNAEAFFDGAGYAGGTIKLGVDVVAISGDTTSADNLESYTDGTTPIPSNVTQISGDTTAADNLEAYSDGTTPQPVNVTTINGSTTGVAGLDHAARTVTRFTVGSGSTTTSIVTSSMTPAASVTDQFKGLILKFANDTTTAALRGQGTDITASTAGGTLTVTALTTAAVSSDYGTVQ